MTVYRTYAELEGDHLGFGDAVIFFDEASDTRFTYHVCDEYLSDENATSNALIFTCLGVTKRDLAYNSYGYAPEGGHGDYSWPMFYEDDYEAATRLVLELFKLWEAKFEVKGVKLFNKIVKEATCVPRSG